MGGDVGIVRKIILAILEEEFIAEAELILAPEVTR